MKDIPGYEGLYAVTKDGRVWSYPKPCSSKRGMWLKAIISKHGDKRNSPREYKAVSLRKNKKRKSFLIHRLVAAAFIKNPENKPFVNHIDGNSLNNSALNLEWVTNKENIDHAIKTGLIKRRFADGEIVELLKISKFNSISKIAKAYKISYATLWDILSGRRYAEVAGSPMGR
jgi:hypothetical protein